MLHGAREDLISGISVCQKWVSVFSRYSGKEPGIKLLQQIKSWETGRAKKKCGSFSSFCATSFQNIRKYAKCLWLSNDNILWINDWQRNTYWAVHGQCLSEGRSCWQRTNEMNPSLLSQPATSMARKPFVISSAL